METGLNTGRGWDREGQQRLRAKATGGNIGDKCSQMWWRDL